MLLLVVADGHGGDDGKKMKMKKSGNYYKNNIKDCSCMYIRKIIIFTVEFQTSSKACNFLALWKQDTVLKNNNKSNIGT